MSDDVESKTKWFYPGQDVVYKKPNINFKTLTQKALHGKIPKTCLVTSQVSLETVLLKKAHICINYCLMSDFSKFRNIFVWSLM